MPATLDTAAEDTIKVMTTDYTEEKRKTLERLRRLGLCGLANETKWRELCNQIQALGDAAPLYRFKVFEESATRWDRDWNYHMPPVMASVEWMDILLWVSPYEEREHSSKTQILKAVCGVGLEYAEGTKMLRIFGYSPKDMHMFDKTGPHFY